MLQHQLHCLLGLVGRVLVLRSTRLTISRSVARTLSRWAQSTLMFFFRFSVQLVGDLLQISSVSSPTADSLLASAS